MKVKVYLDTSIISAYFDVRDKKRQEITKKWWKEILIKKYEVYISELVERELNETKDKKRRDELLGLIEGIKILEITEEIEELSKAYIENEIIPEGYIDDALHIAIATVKGIELLISWNFTHMVNYEVKHKVKGVNILKGYKEIEIESPLELGGGEYE